ncbi:hypothetical protein AHiyo6_07070 [Arthrobacter sp. Hiyo6]|nr:hypothetical protein AHiyo6_07070 [Arthrobacter sp. Hiyo6]
MDVIPTRQLFPSSQSELFHQCVIPVVAGVPGRDRKRRRAEGGYPRAHAPGQRFCIGAAGSYFGGQSAQTAVRPGDDLELFLLQFSGQHRVPGRILRAPAQIMEAQDFSGQGQETAISGVHDQKFFLNTKSTHVLSVAHKSVVERPHPVGAASPGEQQLRRIQHFRDRSAESSPGCGLRMGHVR